MTPCSPVSDTNSGAAAGRSSPRTALDSAAISLFAAVFNFCKIHGTLGATPAHGAGIADGPWTIEKLIGEATEN